MKKNLRKLIMVGALSLTMLVPSTGVFAATSQTLSSFKLPAYQAVVTTSNIDKETDGGQWTLKITSLSNATAVDTYLGWTTANIRYSDYETVGTGTHHIDCIDSATSPYSYHAVLMNSNSTSSTGYLSGKWSPDYV